MSASKSAQRGRNNANENIKNNQFDMGPPPSESQKSQTNVASEKQERKPSGKQGKRNNQQSKEATSAEQVNENAIKATGQTSFPSKRRPYQEGGKGNNDFYKILCRCTIIAPIHDFNASTAESEGSLGDQKKSRNRKSKDGYNIQIRKGLEETLSCKTMAESDDKEADDSGVLENVDAEDSLTVQPSERKVTKTHPWIFVSAWTNKRSLITKAKQPSEEPASDEGTSLHLNGEVDSHHPEGVCPLAFPGAICHRLACHLLKAKLPSVSAIKSNLTKVNKDEVDDGDKNEEVSEQGFQKGAQKAAAAGLVTTDSLACARYDLARLTNLSIICTNENRILEVIVIPPSADKPLHVMLKSKPIEVSSDESSTSAASDSSIKRVFSTTSSVELKENLIGRFIGFLQDVSVRLETMANSPDIPMLYCPSGKRRFFYDVHETPWGSRLFVSQVTYRHRIRLGVPLDCVVDFRDRLSDLIDLMQLTRGNGPEIKHQSGQSEEEFNDNDSDNSKHADNSKFDDFERQYSNVNGSATHDNQEVKYVRSTTVPLSALTFSLSALNQKRRRTTYWRSPNKRLGRQGKNTYKSGDQNSTGVRFDLPQKPYAGDGQNDRNMRQKWYHRRGGRRGYSNYQGPPLPSYYGYDSFNTDTRQQRMDSYQGNDERVSQRAPSHNINQPHQQQQEYARDNYEGESNNRRIPHKNERKRTQHNGKNDNIQVAQNNYPQTGKEYGDNQHDQRQRGNNKPRNNQGPPNVNGPPPSVHKVTPI